MANEHLPEPGSDPRTWDSDQLWAIIELYIGEERRDFKMVVGALRLLAVKDPSRAQLFLDAFDLATTLRSPVGR